MTRNDMQELKKLEIVYADSDISLGSYYFIILRQCKFIPIKISGEGIFEYKECDNYESAVMAIGRTEYVNQDYMSVFELCQCLQ